MSAQPLRITGPQSMTRTFLGLFIGAYELQSLWVMAEVMGDTSGTMDRKLLLKRRAKDGTDMQYVAELVQASVYSSPWQGGGQ